MDEMERLAHAGDLADELARCRPFLEPALAYNGGTHAWDDIVALVTEGRAQLWPAPDAALVTEVSAYPRKTICNVFLGGGRLARLLEMIPSVETWAQIQGCDALTVHGRRGWQRVLARHGASPLHIVMSKELPPCPVD